MLEQGKAETRQAHNIRIWLALLLVICLGSLGSLSLAPSLLPGLVHNNSAVGTSVQTAHFATPIPPTPTPITGPFSESECTATAQSMKYLSTSAGTGSPQALSLDWLQAGRGQTDFANAQACAATFINTYATFNAADAKSFETAVPMLTDGAKQRFYGNTLNTGAGTPALNTQPDQHMDAMWRATLQKQQVQQKTQSSQPGLLQSKYTDSKLLVWLVVPCQLTIQSAGSKAIVENDQYTVLLVGVPVNTQKTGTGWQVSQWQEGSTQFAAPHPL